MNDREACIAVNMISGLGYVKYMALRERFSTADELRAASRSELMEVEGVGKTLAERIVNFDWDAELTRELAIAERGGVQILTIADENYPAALRELYDPPLVLYIRGRLPENPERTVAIVGSRRISAYGETMSEIISEEAVQCGFTIISGLANGVDTIAHRTAVKMAGRTIGVLGGGLMHFHPKDNLSLAREMVRGGGAVISEFPLDFPVSRVNFPRRNRIVAALARATLVIEAGVDSGALITARLAADLGRDVFALPGRVDNPQALGCHKLIKDGAYLMESFDDVMVAMNMALSGHHTPVVQGGDATEGLDNDCLKIYHLLENGDADLEDIHMALGMDVGMILAALMKMELRMLVERDARQYYHLLSKRTGLSTDAVPGDDDLL